jgi:hypothetical protein
MPVARPLSARIPATLSDINRVRDLVGGIAGVRRTRTLLVMNRQFDRR